MIQQKLIGIDPGHVGGAVFDLRICKINGTIFHEGDFCFAWAECLQAYLQKSEIKTVLSHNKDRRSVEPDLENEAFCNLVAKEIQKKNREELLQRYDIPVFVEKDYAMADLVRTAIINGIDLQCRARLMNFLEPDFLLSLHLNGSLKNITTNENGILGYINQAAWSQLDLFASIIDNIAKVCNLPLMLGKMANECAPAIYERSDLVLLKECKIPTLFIEGPFQNNIEEIVKLQTALAKYKQSGELAGRLGELTHAIAEVLCG